MIVSGNSSYEILLGGATKSFDGDVVGHIGQFDFWVIKLSEMVKIEELNENNFSIFPNPTSEILNLKWDSQYNISLIEVVNLHGNRIITQKVKGGQTSTIIDVNQLPNGIYTLRFNNSWTSRFVKY